MIRVQLPRPDLMPASAPARSEKSNSGFNEIFPRLSLKHRLDVVSFALQLQRLQELESKAAQAAE